MNIMKTNMLLLDNKIIKEDAGNTTTVDAPVPSPVGPKEGMKALSFLGMQNLMANPKLASKVGVMNDKSAEEPKAENYVAPYSSNMAFKGGLKTATKALAVTAALAGAAALQSCEKIEEHHQTVQIVDINVDALIEAITNSINSLKQEIVDLKAQLANSDVKMTAMLKEMIAALTKALSILENIDKNVGNQNVSIEEFKAMVYAQNGAILDAIATLQSVTIEEARAQVDRILDQLAKGNIDIKEALAELQALLKINNALLGEILGVMKDIRDGVAASNEQKDSLIVLANKMIANQEEIKANQKYADSQREKMISQKDSLIKINNGLREDVQALKLAVEKSGADQQAKMQEVADSMGVKYDSIINILSSLNIPAYEGMTKEELTAYLEKYLKQLDAVNDKLAKLDTSDLLKAAKEIIEILNKISGQLADLLAKVDSILTSVNKIAPVMQVYGDSILSKQEAGEKILEAIKANGAKIDITNITNNEIKELLKGFKPQVDSLKDLAKERNMYLSITSNQYQPKVTAALDSINAKAGKGLTADELEALWQAHDAAAFAQFKAYFDGIHADDMTKAGEVLGYQKAGNQTLLDIYNKLSDKLKNLDKLNPEELKALLTAIKDYLPELKCNCNCQGACTNNTVHEGIIDNIIN